MKEHVPLHNLLRDFGDVEYRVNFYETDQKFGGKEEGGWWYYCGYPMHSKCEVYTKGYIPGKPSWVETVLEYLERVQKEYEIAWDWARAESKAQQTKYVVHIETCDATYWPKEQPHYE